MLQLILSYRQKDLMSGFFNNPMHPFHILVLGVLLVLGSSFLFYFVLYTYILTQKEIFVSNAECVNVCMMYR